MKAKLRTSIERAGTIKPWLCHHFEKELTGAIEIDDPLASDVPVIGDQPVWIMVAHFEHNKVVVIVLECVSLSAYVGPSYLEYKPIAVGKKYKTIYGDVTIMLDDNGVYIRRRYWENNQK